MSNNLSVIAQAMVAPGKGILAADESTGTIGTRFDSIKVENIEENRRAYRDMLFTTKGIGNAISGVILYDETLRQKSADGTSFVDLLNRNGVLPGIKVDTGAKDLALCTGEMVTEQGTIPASGKRQRTPAAFLFEFEGEELRESRHYFDLLTFLKQIGAA